MNPLNNRKFAKTPKPSPQRTVGYQCCHVKHKPHSLFPMIPRGLVFGAIALTLWNILFYKYTSIGISVLTCLIQVQIKFNKLERLPRILLNGLLATSPPFEDTFDSCAMIS